MLEAPRDTVQANMNQNFANLSIHQPGRAPNPGHDEIIYEDIDNYLARDNDMIPPDKTGDNEYVDMIPPAKTGDTGNEYVDMIPPAKMAEEEEHYVDVQPPTLERSKPEEDYEHYVDVEPPTTECRGINADGEPFYDAINYEAIASLRNPATPRSNKANVTQPLPERPLPPTPVTVPKRKAPPPPPLKTQSSGDNHPPSLKPQFRRLSLPAQPTAVHMKPSSQRSQELNKMLAPKPLSTTENTQQPTLSSMGPEPVVLPPYMAPATAKSTTKPQLQEHVHALTKEPVHSSAANPSGQSVKPSRKAPNPPPSGSQTLKKKAPPTHHASVPAQPDQKIDHGPSPVAQQLTRRASEPILLSEAPPPYHQINPQQPQQSHAHQPYPYQAYSQHPYPQQQPRPQQPYPQQQPHPQHPYPQQQPRPQQPYPQQQPRPQHPYPQQQPRPQQPYPQQQPRPQQPYPQQQPRPQQPYPQQQPRPQQPYPQYSYPPQAYPQQPYPHYPPQPHMTSPYRQAYPQPGYQQNPPQPGYRPPYPVQQYHQQAQPQQGSFVQIHTGDGGVMTTGTHSTQSVGGMAHTVAVGSGHTSVPVQAANTSAKKHKKKK